MQTDPPKFSESMVDEESYVSAASDAIRKAFGAGEGISTSLSKDSLTITYNVSRDSLSRGQIEAIMAAHLMET